MNYLVIGLQFLVAFSILNVWLLRYNQPSKYRGGGARDIFEEFRVYGFPDWAIYAIGTIKVLLAILLLMAVWFPVLRDMAALGLAVMLLGSIIMHIKVKDPPFRSLPATALMVLCLFILYLG